MNINGWNTFVERIKAVIEGTFHTNDLSMRDAESDLCFAVEQLAKENGMPDPEFEED